MILNIVIIENISLGDFYLVIIIPIIMTAVTTIATTVTITLTYVRKKSSRRQNRTYDERTV